MLYRCAVPSRFLVLGVALVLTTYPRSVHAQCDFSSLTQLGTNAVAGIGVASPIPAFEILILHDGVPVYNQAFGSAGLGQVYAADSATKTISGALIMSLVDSSVQPFTLDTRISDYIPQFAGLKAPITIRQAFSHTSNLRNNPAIDSQTLSLQQVALDIADDTIRCFAGACTSGTSFSYGGTSMQAAGAVAEIASGPPGSPVAWNTLFQQRIAGPLQWTQTNYYIASSLNPRIGAGCESTALEFSRLMEMIRREGVVRIDGQDVRVLSVASARAMVSRQTPVGVPIAFSPILNPPTDGADYGVGVWLGARDMQGDLLGCLAAGARGFSAWVDFEDNIVGVFATDATNSENVQPLLTQIRDAARLAVRACIQVCDSIDFNNDTSVYDPLDIEAFLSVYAEGPCIPASATCNDIDFNNDGSFFDPQDIDAFLRVYSEGPCQQ